MHEDTSQIDFPFAGRRQVRAAFDAGPISSDGGLLLLRQADRRLGLTEALAQALPDWREKRRVEHSDLELIRQRIYGICAGYEDCNDAKTMRRDPALKAACDRDPDQGQTWPASRRCHDSKTRWVPRAAICWPRNSSSRICSGTSNVLRGSSSISIRPTTRCTASRSFAISAPTTTSTFTNRC